MLTGLWGWQHFPSFTLKVDHTHLQRISKEDNKVLQIQHQVRVVAVGLWRERDASQCVCVKHLIKPICLKLTECVLRAATILDKANSQSSSTYALLTKPCVV